ncbi:MAG: nucleotidyltransferase family protein [Candidatus Bathyarchaeia archaeon]
MKAAILVGGAGTRLLPLTYYVPKCMIFIGGKPFLDYVIEYLIKHDIDEVILLVSDEDYDVFYNYYENGKRFNIKISYSSGPRIGTAGALYLAKDLLESTFVTYYGDVLTDFDLTSMINFHKSKRSICTLALSRGVPIEYGVGKIDESGKLIYFEEKPILHEHPISMGIYVMEPEVLDFCKPNLDIASDVIPILIKKRLPIYGYITERPHYDIGTFKHLDVVKKIIERRRKNSS